MAIRHPGIVACLGTTKEPGRQEILIVSELMEHNLNDWISNETVDLDADMTVSIVKVSVLVRSLHIGSAENLNRNKAITGSAQLIPVEDLAFFRLWNSGLPNHCKANPSADPHLLFAQHACISGTSCVESV